MSPANAQRFSPALNRSRQTSLRVGRISSDGVSPCAFTLVEILTVLTIMAILTGILLPTTASVRSAAQKARTRAQFQQWALALEEFRGEYGYFPDLVSGALLDAAKFYGALTARDHAGVSVTGSALGGNSRRLSFYTPANSERLVSAAGEPLAELVDAFSNSQFVLLLDGDGDGVIRGTELQRRALSTGNSRDGFGPAILPDSAVFTAETVIASRVAIYSAGAGGSPAGFVYSWK